MQRCMQHAALVGVHRLQRARAARGLYLRGNLAGKAGERFLPLVAVALGVNGDAGITRFLAAAVDAERGKVCLLYTS